jgi:hypothetical protein
VSFAFGLSTEDSRQSARNLAWGFSFLPQAPKRLLSDHSREFEAKVVRLLLERSIGVGTPRPKRRRTTPLAERFNQTIRETFAGSQE